LRIKTVFEYDGSKSVVNPSTLIKERSDVPRPQTNMEAPKKPPKIYDSLMSPEKQSLMKFIKENIDKDFDDLDH